MRQALSAALLALVIGQTSLAAPSATAQTVADVFAPARQHLLHHDYAAASASYKRGLKRQTGTARDYYQAARAAARNQEPKQALDWLTQAVAKGYYAEADLQTEEDFAALAIQPTWLRLLTRARTKQQHLRWSGKSGHGESNFPLSWKQQNQPVNGHEPSTMQPFGPRQSAA